MSQINEEKDYSVNNKRLAINAIYLYVRTFVIMIVTLYTSRVILQVLGETDYGVYNVVGGITLMFTFVTTALTSATQRFMNFEIGRGDVKTVRDVFCMSMNIYLIFAALVVILGETIGLWFLNTQLNIPEERMYAAQWVYQFSILASCINLIRIPYNASIIAYEKMSFYAYISIAEAVLKLGMVYLLLTAIMDSLILYSVLFIIVTIVIFWGYYIYCIVRFDTCRYKAYWNQTTSKKLLSFSGWSVFGSAANLGANQGVSFILNFFCGVVSNTALGISHQVQIAFHSFVGGFQTAFNPQLVKSYAQNDKASFLSLINRSSRISYFLMLIPSVPMFFWCEDILNLWLGKVPEYAVEFTKIIILFSLTDSMSNPLWISVQATGNVKLYQCWVSLLILLNLPFAYLVLKQGFSPVYVLAIRVILNFFVHIGRMIHLHYLVDFQIIHYIKEVSLRHLSVSFLAIVYPLLSFNIHFVLNSIITTIITVAVVFICGLTQKERVFIFSKLVKQIRK